MQGQLFAKPVPTLLMLVKEIFMLVMGCLLLGRGNKLFASYQNVNQRNNLLKRSLNL